MELKEKIIHESLKLFSLKGFVNSSIGDVLAATGSSKGGFYNHFKRKDELFLAVLGEARRIWRAKVLHGLDRVDDPAAKVRLMLVNYRDRYLCDSEDIPGGCVLVTLSVELDDQRPDFSAEVSRGFDGVRRLLTRLLTEAKERKRIPAEVDPDSLARMLFSGMLGASVLFGADKSADAVAKALDPFLNYFDGLTISDNNQGG